MHKAIRVVTAVTLVLAATTASALPPPPEDGAAYATNATRYASIDGKNLLSLNTHAARWAHVSPATPVAPGAPVPMDLPPYAEEFGGLVSCGDAMTVCIEFRGIAVALSKAVKPAVGAKWRTRTWAFEVTACLSPQLTPHEACRLHLVKFQSAATSGWYWWSAARGVEAFAAAGTDGRPMLAYTLVSQMGLLK
jgi:hypothetical protein